MQNPIISVVSAALASICTLTGRAALAAGNHAETDMTQVIKDYRELNATVQMVQSVLDTYSRAMEERSVEIMEQAVIVDDFSTIESGYPNWTWADFRDNHLAVEMQAFKDVDTRLSTVRRMSLEEALEFINDDELVEVTPAAIRLRKRTLDHSDRRREEKRRAAS